MEVNWSDIVCLLKYLLCFMNALPCFYFVRQIVLKGHWTILDKKKTKNKKNKNKNKNKQNKNKNKQSNKKQNKTKQKTKRKRKNQKFLQKVRKSYFCLLNMHKLGWGYILFMLLFKTWLFWTKMSQFTHWLANFCICLKNSTKKLPVFLQTRIMVAAAKFNCHDSGSHFKKIGWLKEN